MIFLLFIITTAFASPEIYNFNESQLNLKFGIKYFSTSQNFEDQGSSTLVNERSFYQINPFFKARYDWSNELSTYGLVNLSYSVSDDATNRLNSFTLSSFTFGLNYSLGEWFFKHNSVLELDAPLQGLNTSSVVILPTDGVVSVRGGDFFYLPIKNFVWINYIGLKYRAAPLSSLFEWKTLSDWQIKKVNLGFGFSGFTSVTDDTDTNNGAARRSFLNLVNQGSLAYASINPTLLQIDFTSGYRISHFWEVNLDMSYSLAGIRHANGFSTMIYFNFKKNPQEKIWYKNTNKSEGFEYQEDEPSLDQNKF